MLATERKENGSQDEFTRLCNLLKAFGIHERLGRVRDDVWNAGIVLPRTDLTARKDFMEQEKFEKGKTAIRDKYLRGYEDEIKDKDLMRYDESIEGAVMGLHLYAKYPDAENVSPAKKERSILFTSRKGIYNPILVETARVAVLTCGIAKVNSLKTARAARDESIPESGSYIYIGFRTLSGKEWMDSVRSKNVQSGFDFSKSVRKIRIGTTDMGMIAHFIDENLHDFSKIFLQNIAEAQKRIEYLR